MVKIADDSDDRSENATPELADALSVALGGEPAREAAGFAFDGLGGRSPALPPASPIPPSTPIPEGPLWRRRQVTSFRKLSFTALSRRHPRREA